MSVSAHAPADARVPVAVRLRVRGGKGRTLDVRLASRTSVVDRLSRRLITNDTTLTLALSFVPTAVGPAPLRVLAALDDERAPAIVDAVVDIRDARWPVLFYDPRPSWSSTFVRRTIEQDPRFVVTSRVVTSRNVSADIGNPPARLADLPALARFTTVVVGGADSLSDADQAGLDAFMRRRGGSVVLLLDQRPRARDMLTGVSAWTTATTPIAATVSSVGDSASLRATMVAYPATLPPGANAIAGGTHPVMWQSATGAGRLVVSGALDAWRFRDPSASGFARFWRTEIAALAAAAPSAIELEVSNANAAPEDLVHIRATVRDLALQPSSVNAAHASVAATLDGAPPFHLWPTGNVGEFAGSVRAPSAPGAHELRVAAGDVVETTPIVVAHDSHHAAVSDTTLLAAWARARHGALLPASRVERLPAMLGDAVQPTSRVEIWHPMRAPWWLVPFALALSGEWWLRRRRGLR